MILPRLEDRDKIALKVVPEEFDLITEEPAAVLAVLKILAKTVNLVAVQ